MARSAGSEFPSHSHFCFGGSRRIRHTFRRRLIGFSRLSASGPSHSVAGMRNAARCGPDDSDDRTLIKTCPGLSISYTQRCRKRTWIAIVLASLAPVPVISGPGPVVPVLHVSGMPCSSWPSALGAIHLYTGPWILRQSILLQGRKHRLALLPANTRATTGPVSGKYKHMQR
jgi:hypothetical protein